MTYVKLTGRSMLGAFFASMIMFVGISVLPYTGGGPFGGLGAAPAAAWQVGWDRDHSWAKVTRAEIAAGATSAVCSYFAGIYGPRMCPVIAQAMRQAGPNDRGVWVEVWPAYCTSSRSFWRGGRLYWEPATCFPFRTRSGLW